MMTNQAAPRKLCFYFLFTIQFTFFIRQQLVLSSALYVCTSGPRFLFFLNISWYPHLPMQHLYFFSQCAVLTLIFHFILHANTTNFCFNLFCTIVHTLCDLDLDERGLIGIHVPPAPTSPSRGYHAITGYLILLSLSLLLSCFRFRTSFLCPHLFCICLHPQLC